MVGDVYGRLTVLSEDRRITPSNGKKIRKRVFCTCRCECGNVKDFVNDILVNGHAKSCGCLRIETASKRMTKHGHSASRGKASRAYHSWSGAIDRCTNRNSVKYPIYGGRGITICDRWKYSFESFLEDMGEPPFGMSIERIDVNGNYEPSNCRWATNKEQSRNTRTNVLISHKGKTMCISEWAEELGVNPGTLYQRLNRSGWSVDKALTTPVKKD
jgi:hypothetical protein